MANSSMVIEFVERNKLEQILLIRGEDRLNEYRDELRSVSEELGMYAELTKINAIISALLSTHDAKVLSTDSARVLAVGNPMGHGKNVGAVRF